jgi:hypothetical protein
MAAARPELARLESLGKSREGRELWCLTLTDFAMGKPEDKPAYVVHGNIHASELSGTHAALYTARQLLADYPATKKLLANMVFHIVPRINPDGAEVVVTGSGHVRSRMDRSDLPPNCLVAKDMNGDGQALSMRIRRADGNMTADPKEPRLMIPRKAESKGPFYRLLPEGEISNWDGSDNIVVEGRSIDWNRQWSHEWKPEPEQGGSGDFPYSEPEMRHFAEFIVRHPNIFGVLGYHTGPAAFLRPPSTGTDKDLDEEDLRRMEELGAAAKKFTGLPVVPVYRYCGKKRRDISLYGHFPGTGYQHWGLFVFEFELGTMMDSAGMGFEDYAARDTEEDHQEAMRRLMRWWDRRGRRPKLFVPWRKFRHPQLGAVEIGGIVPAIGSGMTMTDLKKRCGATYKFTLHHAGQHPLVRLEDLEAKPLGCGLWRVRVRVANRGAFPTHITQRGAKLRRLQPVRVEFRIGKGMELLSLSGHQQVGHLDGPAGQKSLEWFLRAPRGGTCKIAAIGGTGGNAAAEVRLKQK